MCWSEARKAGVLKSMREFHFGGRAGIVCVLIGGRTEAVASIRGEVKRYLYEPNASILKAGAFKAVATRFGLNKLHVNSHLYTSDEVVPSFPGRSFVVDEVIPFTNKQCKTLSRQIPQANITVRNFPLSVDELRKRTKIADGGTIYLFATTLENGDKVLIKTHKI